MRRVVCTCNVNSTQDRVWIETMSTGHLGYSLRAECVLGVDVEDIAIKTTIFNGHGTVDGKLVSNLGLPRTECLSLIHI